MIITVSTTISRARYLLQDLTGIRWTNAELMAWINEGRREMVALKPDVFGLATDVTYTTVAGCSQRITTDGAFKIVSVDSNVTSGKAIRPTTKQQLDSFRPGWRSDNDADDVRNWFPDETDPLRFWIYPPVGASKSLKTHTVISPSDVTLMAEPVLTLERYEPALVNYVCFRALSKQDNGKPADQESMTRATAYHALFVEGMK